MPIIVAPTPVAKPAVAAYTLPDLWLLNVGINMPVEGPGRAAITYMPWNSTSGKSDPDAQKVFVIPDLMDKLENDPDFLEAWEKVTFVVAKYMAAADPPIAQEPD